MYGLYLVIIADIRMFLSTTPMIGSWLVACDCPRAILTTSYATLRTFFESIFSVPILLLQLWMMYGSHGLDKSGFADVLHMSLIASAINIVCVNANNAWEMFQLSLSPCAYIKMLFQLMRGNLAEFGRAFVRGNAIGPDDRKCPPRINASLRFMTRTLR